MKNKTLKDEIVEVVDGRVQAALNERFGSFKIEIDLLQQRVDRIGNWTETLGGKVEN